MRASRAPAKGTVPSANRTDSSRGELGLKDQLDARLFHLHGVEDPVGVFGLGAAPHCVRKIAAGASVKRARSRLGQVYRR